jgi:chromosome segregation ATPase
MSEPSSISKLKESIANLKTAIDEYSLAVEKKIEELKAAKGLAENTVALSKEEQEKIKVEIADITNQKTTLIDVLETKETELDNAIEENRKIGEEMKTLTGKLELKDLDLKAHTDELVAQQDEINRLNTNIAGKEREADQLRDELNTLQAASIEEQRINADAIAAKDKKIQEIRDENAALSAEQQIEIERLNQEKTDLETANSSAIEENNAEIARLKTEYNTRENELNTSIEEFRKATSEATETINKLQSDLEKSTTATADEKEKNKTLLSEIIKKQTKLAEQTNKIKEANDAVIAMQSQINDLQSKQEDLTSQHSDCKEKMDELNREIEEANKKINELQELVEGNTRGLNASNPSGDFDNDDNEEESTAPSNPDTKLDDNFGIEGTVFHPLGSPYQENGKWYIKLKGENSKETTIPYNKDTELPQNDETGASGIIINWSKDYSDDSFIKKSRPKGSEPGSSGEQRQKYTVKGGRRRKASKTMKNSAKKHTSNKRNTKRKHKHHKKQTYKR